MAKTNSDKKKTCQHPEAKGLALIAFSLVLLLCLLSFNIKDPGQNWLGLIGHGIAWSFCYVFGLPSYLLIPFAGWMGWKLLCDGNVPNWGLKTFYFSAMLVSFCILLNLIAEHAFSLIPNLKLRIYSESVFLPLPYPHEYTRFNLGGSPLYYLYRDLPTFNMQRMLSDVGIVITFSIIGAVAFLLLTETHIVPFVRICARWIRTAFFKLVEELRTPKQNSLQVLQKQSPEQIESTLTKRPLQPAYKPPKESEPKIRTISDLHPKEEKEKSENKPPVASKRDHALRAQRVYNGDFTAYQLPPPSLLTNPKKVDLPSLKKDLRKQAEILEESLMSFGIEAKVGEINCGPTITSFEVHPAVGVKVQKIKALENDIALNLQAKSIRIIAPIPGKAAVGVEVPSLYPQEVSFKEMLLGYQQNPRKFHIPILLGKTVNGENVMSDLTKMPHCMIAGATGSGKSVCINTVILSILMNARPDEIKLMMIDPKKVELTPYTSLPHMIAPVITEAHGAYAALSWLVKEMQTRYEILKQLGMRNITAFNNRHINKELEASLSIPIPERMYAIVAIIDEFADLMMVSSSDLETPIARIAQMARAVGIHLILATQRPSREVITGIIKANFPTRIAFKVASRINSQIILDETGAESLLGNGDMLFLPPGSSHLIRAQGAYISDEDINRIVSFICNQAPANYLIESFDSMRREDQSSGDGNDEGSRDSLYEQARSIVLETKNASTTYLQRKLKIGYARAASLMDELEAKGIIGPQEGSKPRRILQPGAGLSTQDKSSFSFDEEMDISD
ncbi:MAG TPA: DNA translocase FtsK 4TM domain-containing protein [Rhabdochlamydiaceae bacterium]|nr:DNA translocase FtsK 4TM domain-containing protein [Rhabdochlamydiaceae bacterium]